MLRIGKFIFVFLIIFQSVFSPSAFSEQSVGVASWYSESDPSINLHTANGEVFDDSQMTCASWDYPFGTILRVTSVKNGKSIVCRVNDRGPSKRLGRLIDLTKSGFGKMAPLKAGLIQVKVEKMPRRALLLNQHVNTNPYQHQLYQSQERFTRNSFQDLLGHIGPETHYDSKTQAR